MDLAQLKLDGFDIFLFGCPGLLRFKVMREVIANGADGYIFIFDAAHPKTDNNAISMLNLIRKTEVPIVYLANKQDINDARAPEVIIKQNNLPEDCIIFPTSTKSGLNIKRSINYLVNEIYKNYQETLAILLNFEDDIRGLAEKLNKNKVEIRDFLNNLEVRHLIDINRTAKTFKVRKGLKNLSV
jgi:GTPase SAR1 family protein